MRRIALLAWCCLAIPATRLHAQAIRGRVVLSDSVTPAVGIVVTAARADGSTAARALTSPAGDYVLALPAPGTYELRALRIGFRPSIVRDIAVAANATRVQNIVLSSLAITIAGMDVRGSGDCALKGRDGQTFLQLWEQARGALAATHLWELSGALDVHLVRVDGHMDAVYYTYEPTYAEVDTASARESIVDRAFAATPPETLFARGYLRTREDGRDIYDMPNAETLLSDQFVGAHCFSIQADDDHKNWIGLGFKPRRDGDVTDIRGVLWMDRATAELRRIEFTYTNLPPAAYDICDKQPFIPLTPERLSEVLPPFRQPPPTCWAAKNDRSNRLRLGGQADFMRLSTGEWLVARWMLRTPPDEGRFRALPHRTKLVNRQWVRCYGGGPCHTVVGMFPRLVTKAGAITRVARDGVELFRNDSAEVLVTAMAVRRAGRHPAGFTGTITDADGRPLSHAVVQADSVGRAAMTDSAGTFSLRVLPADTTTVSVRCRGYQPVRFVLPLLPDSTRRISLSLARDTTRSASTNCGVADR